VRRAASPHFLGAVLDLPTGDEVEKTADSDGRQAMSVDELGDAANPDQVLLTVQALVALAAWTQ
jgi:hypothetical protein